MKNTGICAGKEVVQLYVAAPQGALGKPARELKAYGKTEELAPGEECTLKISVPKAAMASYDDSGAAGHKSCWVLEAGTYVFHVGTDVRSASPAGSLVLEETVVVKRGRRSLCAGDGFPEDEAGGTGGGRISGKL